VHGDEESRLVALGDPAALIQRDEDIRIAGHDDAIAAASLKLVAQSPAEGEDNVLLDDAVLLGAGVVAAMAGVDDDDRLVGALCDLFRPRSRAWQRRLHHLQPFRLCRPGRRRREIQYEMMAAAVLLDLRARDDD